MEVKEETVDHYMFSGQFEKAIETLSTVSATKAPHNISMPCKRK